MEVRFQKNMLQENRVILHPFTEAKRREAVVEILETTTMFTYCFEFSAKNRLDPFSPVIVTVAPIHPATKP